MVNGWIELNCSKAFFGIKSLIQKSWGRQEEIIDEFAKKKLFAFEFDLSYVKGSYKGCHRNSVPEKFRRIDSERFALFRGKKCSFRRIPCVFGIAHSEVWNGTEFRKKMFLKFIRVFVFVLE